MCRPGARPSRRGSSDRAVRRRGRRREGACWHLRHLRPPPRPPLHPRAPQTPPSNRDEITEIVRAVTGKPGTLEDLVTVPGQVEPVESPRGRPSARAGRAVTDTNGAARSPSPARGPPLRARGPAVADGLRVRHAPAAEMRRKESPARHETVRRRARPTPVPNANERADLSPVGSSPESTTRRSWGR